MADTFNCPSCGAPLDYDGGSERTIRCPFCNNSVMVPENLLPKPRPPQPEPPETETVTSQPKTSPEISPWGCYLGIGGLVAFVLAMVFIPIYLTNRAATAVTKSSVGMAQTQISSMILSTATPAPAPTRVDDSKITQAALQAQATRTAAVLQETATAVTLQQTATAAWQATAVYGEALLAKGLAWKVAVQDLFKNSGGGWQVGKAQNQYYSGNRTIANGVYRWSLTSRQNFITNEYPQTRSYSDFYASVDVRIVQGPQQDANYGLVFRSTSDDSAWYYFAIDGRESYAVMFFTGSSPDYPVDWTPSADIQVEGVNHLAVAAQGKHVVVFINGKPAAAFDDDQLGQGQVGLSMSMTSVGDTATVEFSNFEVHTP